ncbi:hypothetical protein CesoFtcFv8_020260 [Champsocephalus esox]|uniref:Uncharacterized protein n=1 Tax=Champsocephalus esox TaxID=159716 RepID=A0AAN8BGC1_9TELE|nr:hypothetical protein CesoFtcFv8_020260 [Champsocephalus esox]
MTESLCPPPRHWSHYSLQQTVIGPTCSARGDAWGLEILLCRRRIPRGAGGAREHLQRRSLHAPQTPRLTKHCVMQRDDASQAQSEGFLKALQSHV